MNGGLLEVKAVEIQGILVPSRMQITPKAGRAKMRDGASNVGRGVGRRRQAGPDEDSWTLESGLTPLGAMG